MAKFANDEIMDAALSVVKNNVTRMTACSAQPTTFSEGNTTYALADVSMASADFTLTNGDTSGRKCTVAAKSAVPIDTSGTATHIALLDVANAKLLYVTTCTSLALTAGGGNTVSFPAWKFEIADPS